MVEQKNRTIEEATREMLEENHMPKFYWAELVQTVVYLYNRTSTNGGVSPHELYFGKKPNLGPLRVLRSVAYVHVPKGKRKKPKPRSVSWWATRTNKRVISVITPKPNKFE